jgi:predicted PurR-regulated permease PerM
MKSNTQWSLTFRYTVGLIGFAAIIAFLLYAHEAVTNLVIAAFVAYLINPVVGLLSTRTGMKRSTSVNVVYFTAVILLIGIPATLAPIFYDEFKTVVQDLLALSNQISAMLSQPIQFGSLVFHLEEWAQSISQIQSAVLTPLPGQALQLLETTSVGVLWFLVILVSVYLFLSYWPDTREWLFRSAPSQYRPELEELYNRVRGIWMGYLRGQIVLMLIVGVVFTIVWLIIGIPGALVLGLIAGFFTLVPDVGPFLAAMLAAGVALLEGSSWMPLSNFGVAVVVIIVYLVLINAKNFFLRPIIMGRSVHMNEGVVFIVILIATILEGILGALLVVPVLASVMVIGGYLQRKVLGLPPFEGEDETPFIAPEKIKKEEHASDSPVPASSSQTESQPEQAPARKKSKQ